MAFITITDNPIADYNNYSAELAKKLARLPRCSHCDVPYRKKKPITLTANGFASFVWNPNTKGK